jgi:methyl-accepting chemotaxis protein
MMICNRQGKVLAVNTQDKNGRPIRSQEILNENVAGEAWFRACTTSGGPAGGAWFSDFTANPQVGQIYGTEGYGMAFAAPIRDAQGTIVGVWYNYASWNEVTEGIRQEAEQDLQKDHPGAYVILTKNSGEVISAADKTLLSHALSVSEDNILTEQQAKTSIPVHNLMYGISRSKGAYTFEGKKWITAVFIPKEKISWSIFLSRKNLAAVLVCLLVVFTVAVYIYYFFKKKIISRIRDIQDLQQRLSEGEIIRISDNGHEEDEFGRMNQSLGQLARNLQYKAAFADEISQGHLTAQLEGIHDNDILGNSLMNMRKQLEIAKESTAQRNWMAEGLAQVGVILRSYESLDQLYAKIIKFVITYLKANQGGLFLITGSDDQREITLVGAYAYGKKKFVEKTLSLGQGLIGQSIAEKETIYLTDIPASYIHITSGLGGATPNALLIVPLRWNDEILGVVEMASFEKFKPHEIELAEKLAESIGASLGSIRGSENTLELVTRLQQQTEEMKSQEEEMRQNMEELSATQEEMLRKEKEYLARIHVLENR